MHSIFVSDLHLSPERPRINQVFFDFADRTAARAGAVYILGDLFEYWIGDDDLTEPFHAVIAGFLRRLHEDGVALYVMQGNRDFLMGPAFCRATGATLLDDPAIIQTEKTKTLLMHGDTLCTDDLDYQDWRRTARSAAWQKDFLGKELDQRREIVLALRAKSTKAVQTKSKDIMNVNEEAVRAAFEQHGVARLVHGHTHRPGHHILEVAGRRCERWVLPDWYGPGGYLEIGAGEPRLVHF